MAELRESSISSHKRAFSILKRCACTGSEPDEAGLLIGGTADQPIHHDTSIPTTEHVVSLLHVCRFDCVLLLCQAMKANFVISSALRATWLQMPR